LKSLLVIERERALQFAIKRFFEARHIDVDVCATTIDAYSRATFRKYCALVVDHDAKDLTDELEVVRACRMANPAIVIVALAVSLPGPTEIAPNKVCLKPLPLARLAEVLGL
jgi:DNA-binding response OmpR family regulator